MELLRPHTDRRTIFQVSLHEKQESWLWPIYENESFRTLPARDIRHWDIENVLAF